MTISELIDRLGEILNEHGNLVACTNAGGWGDLEVESVTVLSRPAPVLLDEPPDPPRVVIS